MREREKTREKPWMRTICGVGTLLRRSHDCSLLVEQENCVWLILIPNVVFVYVYIYIQKPFSKTFAAVHEAWWWWWWPGLSVSECSPPSCAALWCGHPPPSPTAFRPLYLLLKTGLFHTHPFHLWSHWNEGDSILEEMIKFFFFLFHVIANTQSIRCLHFATITRKRNSGSSAIIIPFDSLATWILRLQQFPSFFLQTHLFRSI